MNRLVLISCLVAAVSALPDGAPIDVCFKTKANYPNHSGASAQPATTNPYTVVASSNFYRPGDKITVTIRSPPNQSFKGFFMQGRDGKTNEWIGSFSESKEAKVYPECSSATHKDNGSKDSVTLVWNAPRQGSGNVYFTGTVVKNYNTFWADIVLNFYRNFQMLLQV